jgi:hypothetical protein
MIKKILVVLAVASLFPLVPSASAQTGGEAARSVFLSTFYGMAAGALIGSAVSLAQDDPDWGTNIGTGAAIGGVAGAIFSLVSEVRYLVEIDRGKMTAGIPRIDLKQRLVSGREEIQLSAGLLQYRF